MTPQFPADVTTAVRTSQIIAGALMMGVITFGVIAVVIAWNKPPGDPLLPVIAVAFAAIVIPVRFGVSASLVSSSRTHIGNEVRGGRLQDSSRIAGQLYGAFQTRMIVGMALLEGAAFFNLVAYMISARWWNLAAAGVLLLLLAAMFPTKNKLEQWVHDQLQLMEIEQ
jgi:hypothetical protein